jgi:hypothetical protein
MCSLFYGAIQYKWLALSNLLTAVFGISLYALFNGEELFYPIPDFYLQSPGAEYPRISSSREVPRDSLMDTVW